MITPPPHTKMIMNENPRPAKMIHSFEAFRRLCESHKFTPIQIATLAERIHLVYLFPPDMAEFSSATLLDALEKHYRAHWEDKPADHEKPLFLEL